ncbi:triose-phosphate isomerase [Ponticoccus sp. SC2-23]|uniref:triose-phosphate isomerase n=1 Tax=Alexandriicola marinus TaxID=2081710 RepID=UPI000FDBE238|nr:triose-phosphate isomerase [Alexandriicola marinus]MBM1219335.1 triose-phosphate isomerase [Ponticoccus sp. SC6-9]MBM1223593.1 triose-phosphate isomerase [Ponticoccus sp. SC6-15]MBM1229148.1 triose-phosphate isomerase [Ponticoccus sp. SC6-38]MBM1232559.1 triose-phosphate isomerase [Ponticoccus sp. SC6-45]MBM1237491.1 triose-phosphate isomerase [Ponticoccus sp. SC6-49]MBM1241570.1 triose-phosphate isomerase [Ponticoccus sp. SC2-64]MBM1246083.1 triose-phosphate isomerase [Ponticoccus sp. SC
MRKRLAAGNWKMNGTSGSLSELEALAAAHPAPSVEVLICLPATLIERASRRAEGSAIAIGGQDCHAAASGAHTGDIAATMLVDAGASAVIVGHSERRTDHAETSAHVAAKAIAAQSAGLTAIICIGETLQEREAGTTLSVLDDQLAGSLPDGADAGNTVIAYEPVWAIGTGLTPTIDQIDEVHRHLRARLAARGLADIAILYGGSVKGSNAAEIFAVEDVDGALVGGASLTAADFSPIVTALEAS